jgi:cytochrome c
MKKLLVIMIAGALISSCNSSDEGAKKKDETKPDTVVAAVPAEPAPAAVPNERGLELIGGSDCMACHAIDKKVVGPAYIDVAKKYKPTEANIDSLVIKIKKGGMGHWGQVPMTPHPDLPDADAREMVKYILSLNNPK